MHSNQVLFFFLVFLTLNQTAIYAQTDVDYWPLEIGNRWTYRHTWAQYGMVVTLPDGRPVFYDIANEILRFLDTYEVLANTATSDSLLMDLRSKEGEIEVIKGEEEFVAEVLGWEEREGQIYFRLSTGQLLRKDKQGNIVEFSSGQTNIEDKERIIFDFGPSCETEKQNDGYMGIFPSTSHGALGQPWRIKRTEFLARTVMGDFYSGCSFSIGVLTHFSIYFAPNIGPVSSGWSDDQGLFEKYTLISATIQGTKIVNAPTAILTRPSPWGRVKNRLFPAKTKRLQVP